MSTQDERSVSATDNLQTTKRTGKRKSDRVSLSLPIEVTGTDLSGRDFVQKTTTRQISRHGGSMILDAAAGPDQVFTVRLLSGRSQEAQVRIVGQVGIQAQGQVYGFVFQDTTLSAYWGIRFPPLGEKEDYLIKVVLECGGCLRREIISLNEVEFDVFEANDRIIRDCGDCKQSTAWKAATFERLEQPPVCPTLPGELSSRPILLKAEVTEPTWPAINRRRAPRVKVGLKGCVRLDDDEQIVSVHDISRTGIRFHAQRKYGTDKWVQVAVPYMIGGANIFRPARIAWRKEGGATSFEYGLKFVKD